MRSTQNKWVLTHLVRCTDTACLFVCYVRCARFLQMLCACSSLCLRSTETCSSAIVTEGQSRATDGARPNNASIVACKLFDLQGEFKFGVRKKRKNTNKVRAYLFVVRSTQNKWVLTHLVRCTDTACLFVCYVRCARFLQMLCACSSLCLRSTETCSSAIVTEGQSRATDGARPNNASIVACKLFDLQGEFKFGVRKKRKNTNKVRAYLFVVRSPRLELGRCNHTPLKRTRLPIPP